MKRFLFILLLLFAWATVSADEIKKPGKPDKPFSVSIGLYAENISASAFSEDDRFSGYSLAISQVFSDNFGGRISYYSSGNDDLSSFKSDGYDIVLHVGTGLASQGFKAYIGGGYFNNTWEIYELGFSNSFSGLQINGGIGYNWEHVALDFILAIRDPDDYEKAAFDFLGVSTSGDVYSGSLLLSYRF
jgi:hypothetical protein